MSKQVRVSFAPGMPPAIVELFGPDFRPLDSFMLSGGSSNEIDVPPPASFLRIHLPSGRIVTIPDAERLDREITPGMFERRIRDRPELQTDLDDLTVERPSRRTSERITSERGAEVAAAVYDRNQYEPRASVGAPSWQWLVAGARQPRASFEWSFAAPTRQPRELVGSYGPMTVRMRLPGNITSVEIVADPGAMEPHAQRVLLRTANEKADFALKLLHQANLFGTRDMFPWARSFTRDRIRDHYAAAVAGYLLLRLGRTDILREWSDALCAVAPSLPDGAVLHAWVALSGDTNDGGDLTTAARDALMLALVRGVPVYTEGLRLLLEGLRLVSATAELDKLQSNLGRVCWQIPLTTCISLSKRMNRVPYISCEFQSSL